MRIAPIHPFPARMAPEIAIAQLAELTKGSTVVDPMMGSGTVLRHAVAFGHHAIGFDTDPLAVLMSRVWSKPVPEHYVLAAFDTLKDALPKLNAGNIQLPWIDDDPETVKFTEFWFGHKQRNDLRRIAFGLNEIGKQGGKEIDAAVDVLRVALSRIIITKSSGASLAWDVSHSRPHKVMTSSTFDVVSAFEASFRHVQKKLLTTPSDAQVNAMIGDARVLGALGKSSADLVLTSPPYLNAIDYMRGHKLSLVWLGHSISELRAIRSTSVGAERKTNEQVDEASRRVQCAMVDSSKVQAKHLAMIERYSLDLVKSLSQASRVLKPQGRAIYVVGNSCLRDTFIRNSAGVIEAAKTAGFHLSSELSRELPASGRYLPMPKKTDSALGKRMRTESILTFERAA